ncbi:MAG: hypothetical protein MJY62_06225 [Bacteroidales bacterium]|nr:hypothetical protein [Bacteroidales bacterium]
MDNSGKYFEWLEEDLLLIKVAARSPQEALTQRDAVRQAVEDRRKNAPVLMIAQDRLEARPEQYRKRIEAHRKHFRSIFARNCEVRRIDASTCAAFMDANHGYGHATSRYHYGIFHKGALVGAAQFSSARTWTKGEKKIRSCEWVRYASLADSRISGGMGKVLRKFIEEIHPDDIMSYADLEWSDGRTYEKLGFTAEGTTESVLFGIDKDTWKRTPVKNNETYSYYFLNFGSRKFRLKLTQY